MNKALLYRPNSKSQIIAAFAAAITIHLSAIALASHHEPTVPFTDPGGTTVIGFDVPLIEPPPVPPTEIPFSAPPDPTAEFVETERPREISRSRPLPIHSIGQPSAATVSNPKAVAVNAPRPDYPYEARSRHVTGSGVCVLAVDSNSGNVISAAMEQSVGSEILDQSSLSAFRRWRFKRGTPNKVRIPITFTMTGASL